MQPDDTTRTTTDSDFHVDSKPYACRCGAVVYWRATPQGLVILDPDGQPHRARCPLRGVPVLTPRDRYYLANRDAERAPPPVVVKTDPTVDRKAMDRIIDALTEIPVAIDETRKLTQQVARYAAQVDQRSAGRTHEQRTPPAASTPAEPTRGASVVRTRARPGVEEPGP